VNLGGIGGINKHQVQVFFLSKRPFITFDYPKSIFSSLNSRKRNSFFVSKELKTSQRM